MQTQREIGQVFEGKGKQCLQAIVAIALETKHVRLLIMQVVPVPLYVNKIQAGKVNNQNLLRRRTFSERGGMCEIQQWISRVVESPESQQL